MGGDGEEEQQEGEDIAAEEQNPEGEPAAAAGQIADIVGEAARLAAGTVSNFAGAAGLAASDEPTAEGEQAAAGEEPHAEQPAADGGAKQEAAEDEQRAPEQPEEAA